MRIGSKARGGSSGRRADDSPIYEHLLDAIGGIVGSPDEDTCPPARMSVSSSFLASTIDAASGPPRRLRELAIDAVALPAGDPPLLSPDSKPGCGSR